MTTGAETAYSGVEVGDSGAETADSEVEIGEVEAGIGGSQVETVDSGVEIEAEIEAEIGDSVVEIGKVEAGIGDSVAAVGYQYIQFALGIDSPADLARLGAIVQPW